MRNCAGPRRCLAGLADAGEPEADHGAEAEALAIARGALPWLIAGPSKARRLTDRATNFPAPELEDDYTELVWDVHDEDMYKTFLQWMPWFALDLLP